MSKISLGTRGLDAITAPFLDFVGDLKGEARRYPGLGIEQPDQHRHQNNVKADSDAKSEGYSCSLHKTILQPTLLANPARGSSVPS